MNATLRKKLIWGAVAGAAAGILWTALAAKPQPPVPATYIDTVQEVTAAPVAMGSEEQAIISVFERAAPSVVFIKSAAYTRDYFSLDIYEIPQGAGSGFIWDDQGHVVTNFHVIYQASSIEVTLSDQKAYPAKVIGVSPDHDLAVLKIDAPRKTLTPLAVGSSSGLVVGQKALVIGNPFGLDHSLTTGVVSALGRSISSITNRKIHDMIQTDAAINPGNSGGPVLDSSGSLIGVATAIYSPSGAYSGVGFAIPVNTVKRVVPQLIKFGKIKRVGLGISLLPDAIRGRFGLDGAVVLEIGADSAAQKAGLMPTAGDAHGQVILGDIIVAIDGSPIRVNEDLVSFFEQKYQAGDKINIEYLRNGLRKKTTAVLQDL